MKKEEINNILQIKESYEMPSRLMEILNNKVCRENIFDKFMEFDLDMDSDWFTEYYQQEHSDRKEMKQILEAYENGEVITQKNRGADYYVEFAHIMANNLKSTFLQKARSMCKANGVEFDARAFEGIFVKSTRLAMADNIEGEQKYKWSSRLGSESTFDPAGFLNDLTANFKEQYTLWVEKQKAGDTVETLKPYMIDDNKES